MKKRIFAATAISFGILILVQAITPSSAHLYEQEIATTTLALEALENSIAREEERILELKSNRYGQIRAGMGMFQALADLGLDLGTSLTLVKTLSDSVELLNLAAGERIRIQIDPVDTSVVKSFSYTPHPAVSHTLTKKGGGYVYTKIERPCEIRHSLYEGVLERGSSIDQALRALGIHGSMVGTANGVYLCKLPLRTHARAGDRFRILLRERYYQDSIRIDGEVLYVSYEGARTGFFEAFRYDDGDPKSSYTAHYTEGGEALIHSGLRYPLDRLHISSPYGMRRHPMTGRRTMHNGVDYRAPKGTPVYSVAKGKVVKSGYDSRNGNYVAIRHSDGYTSYYLHLNKRSVARGQNVVARQVIGTIGSTGTSTGPHLHFGFKRPNGSWMDPLMKRMIATPKLEGERLVRLTEQIGQITHVLDSVVGDAPATVAFSAPRE